MDFQISAFTSAHSTDCINVNALAILNGIRVGKWKAEIDVLREKSEEEYKRLKTALPAVTFSGAFSQRNKESLLTYSGIVVLDLDNLTDGTVIQSCVDKISEDPSVLACFVSPSGKGLKILYKVNTGAEYHLAAFLHLQNYFQNKYLLKVDDSGKDVSRLCFVSYDEYIYINEDAVPFEVDIRYGEVKLLTRDDKFTNHKPESDYSKVFDLCRKWVEGPPTPIHYAPGSRNRYVHALSCALNRTGVPMADALKSLLKAFTDLPELEISRCAKNAYFKNQSEYASVQVKDIVVGTYKAPPYIMNLTDDVVEKEITERTAMLYHKGVDMKDIGDIISKIVKYYNMKGFIDIDRKTLGQLMNASLNQYKTNVLRDSAEHSLKYETLEEMAKSLMKNNVGAECVQTYLSDFDMALSGGMQPSSVYGVIGLGGTFKSFLLMYICYANASNGVPCLYLSGEMSRMQTYSRLFSMVFGMNLRYEMSQGNITEDNIQGWIDKMDDYFGNNLHIVNGSGFNKQNIEATLANYRAKYGKKIRLVGIDGLSQCDQGTREEAPANIFNSAMCKEIAKDANSGEGVVVMPLIHTSGDQNYLLRDTGTKVRGGLKVLANLDGYFSTSLLMDHATNDLENDDDMMYLPGKFYLRMKDKRSDAGIVNGIINIDNKTLKLSLEACDPKVYEISRK